MSSSDGASGFKFNVDSLKEFSKRICSTVEKSIETQKPEALLFIKLETELFVQQKKVEEECLKKQLAEAEAKRDKLLKVKEVTLEEVRKIEEKKAATQKLKVKLDELKAEGERLKDAGQNDTAICISHGRFLTKLDLDWKSEPGKVKCPGGHVIVAPEIETTADESVGAAGKDSNNNKAECDFWSCAAVNLY